MSQWQRFGYALFGTIALAVLAIVWFRVGVEHLIPLVEAHPGPFDQPVTWMETIVPACILILLLALWAWVLVGSVQEERSGRRFVR